MANAEELRNGLCSKCMEGAFVDSMKNWDSDNLGMSNEFVIMLDAPWLEGCVRIIFNDGEPQQAHYDIEVAWINGGNYQTELSILTKNTPQVRCWIYGQRQRQKRSHAVSLSLFRSRESSTLLPTHFRVYGVK